MSLKSWQFWCSELFEIDTVGSYNKKHSFDIICLSEANVDSAFQYDDERLHLNGLSFARDDNPANNKRGGTGIYSF